ncbi:alpha/beta hydrolase [Salipiger sp. PrR002]|uniref:alpha/beta hydrolase n=1 Tax=Salipiger sp. PrR002 TaxID=2706489 RepID=UPI0013B97380|nr:alpha/beta hydrolase-fold protein [Salipiger sp. PrR002]NDW01128.1 alpha/beta hydrolase [Salipiger sp. PrR002]NDW57931.1 alpha/beta hydrolase [Salipiger sp. PrR004]
MTGALVAEGQALVAGTRWYDLRDRVSGALRRVFLWVPPGEMPKRGWPSLVLTDGNAVIATAVDAMRAQSAYPAASNLGPGVLIAVGYPTEAAFDPLRRSWDLGPPPGATYPPFWPGTPEVRTGGGAEMARFLLEDLRDFLTEQGVILDPSRRGLFGHSFGGLFALWLMFTRPEAFSHWIAASPSITWEDSFLLRHLERFAPAGRSLTVHLSAGEWEGSRLAPFLARPEDAQEAEARRAALLRHRTLEAAREMHAALARFPELTLRFEEYAGETHMSVLSVAVGRALHTVFALR